MQKTQDMRHAPPPVGWLAYCRQVRAVQDSEIRANDVEAKGNHANAN